LLGGSVIGGEKLPVPINRDLDVVHHLRRHS
jgi:hypothetical protein